MNKGLVGRGHTGQRHLPGLWGNKWELPSSSHAELQQTWWRPSLSSLSPSSDIRPFLHELRLSWLRPSCSAVDVRKKASNNVTDNTNASDRPDPRPSGILLIPSESGEEAVQIHTQPPAHCAAIDHQREQHGPPCTPILIIPIQHRGPTLVLRVLLHTGRHMETKK